MKNEIEITRRNVTPAAFLSYVNRQLKKKGLDMMFEAPSLDYLAAGNDLNFNTTHDGMHEVSVSKPYEMQTYNRWEDGTVYNIICEFTFWDDKTGTGYFYAVDTGAEQEQEHEQEQEQEAPAEAPKAPIKSTTKEGKARIRSYILSLYTEAGYDGQPEEGCHDFPKVARFIWDTFMKEKQYSTPQMWRQGISYEAVFGDWCRGLPSVLDTCFCYNRSAVKEVQNLLCQTDEQVKKYSETMAEDYLIHLIYREVKHAVDYEQEGK